MLSGIWVRNAHSGYANEPDTNLIQGDIKNLLLGEFVAADSELKNRNRGRAVLDDQWRSRSRGQLSQNRLGNGGQLGHRGRRVRALLKEDFDYAKAVIRG